MPKDKIPQANFHLIPTSIAEVETAIPAFIGFTEKAKKEVEDDLNMIPTRINSLAEYERYFGKTSSAVYQVHLVENLGNVFNVAIKKIADKPFFRLYYSLNLFFSNGGNSCYIVSVGKISNGTIFKGDDLNGLLGGLSQIEKEDEPTILVLPDAVELNSDDYYAVINEALAQCSRLKDRVVILDVHNEDPALASAISADINFRQYGAAYYPNLETSINYFYTEKNVKVVSHVDNYGEVAAGNLINVTLDEIRNRKLILYNQILAELKKAFVTINPGSAVAGLYVKVDKVSGVWKAPVGPLVNVAAPTIEITAQNQIDLYDGKSINAIRYFANKGTMVWGARTIVVNNSEWRYMPVRRFCNMIEKSIKKSTSWVVFEPNDENTWVKVKAMIENYLIEKWRSGALMGIKPQEAFFAKVGLGSTMTQVDILEGRIIIQIGLAVLRPSEFIILSFSYNMQKS